VYENPAVTKILVVLPENALKTLNCYVVQSQGENLIIDTGFNQEESKVSLLAGLDELDLDPEHTSLFLTHGHSDHTGLVNDIADRVREIFISQPDYQVVINAVNGVWWENKQRQILADGFSREEIASIGAMNPITLHSSTSVFDATIVGDGDIITVGDYRFTCILMPGHSPGHLCLYEPQSQLLFSGDHVLFDISPNITVWPDFDAFDSLGLYLDSLRRLKGLEVKFTLPGHRAGSDDLRGRIDELLHHHDLRLDECLAVLRAHDGVTTVDVASRITWNIRGDSWANYPPPMKMFADGETRAHLEHLVVLGKATVEKVDGIMCFRAV
jgi:glyoxylase-like metal-dependent hydrolase (beta-lactamase superfamily II)